MEYQKLKSAAKITIPNGPELERKVAETLATISRIVGATLGPCGRPVMLERNEEGLPPNISKDGVTVFRALGFQDPVAHCISESTLEVAIRTANEAGDGTTSCVILAEALTRNIREYTKKYPRISPQKVIRHIERFLNQVIEPTIIEGAKKLSMEDEDLGYLMSVARLSANGDQEMAEAVLKCFEITGDEGNVTITERRGNSRYEASKIEGFFIDDAGFERSCRQYYTKFLNNTGRQACELKDTLFLLFNGEITNPAKVNRVLEVVCDEIERTSQKKSLVIVAREFSDQILAGLAANFQDKDTLKVVPFVPPRSPQSNSQVQFLEDLAAVTGSTVMDPLQFPLEKFSMEFLGPPLEGFECTRTRAMVFGNAGPELLLKRIDELKKALAAPESSMDVKLLTERIANISGGIARLVIYGSSSGELKEKAARADDAVCAVKGAIKRGCLPGGGSVLLRLATHFDYENDDIVRQVLVPTFKEPFMRLCQNAGMDKDEIEHIQGELSKKHDLVYDFLAYDFVDPFKAGILDSVPAVTESLRSSISIATLVGTLGGVVVLPRNSEYEMQEAKEHRNYMKQIDAPSEK